MYKFAFSPEVALSPSCDDIRVAVVSYLLGRHLDGALMLRLSGALSLEVIEDEFLETLRWLGIEFDSIVREVERLYYYREVAISLVGIGKAYRCFCVDEGFKVLPRCASGCGLLPSYESERRAEGGEPFAIRLRVGEGSVMLRDVLLGDVVVNNDTVGDFIILYPDGSPSFGFASSVDDMEFAVTHVVRESSQVEWAMEEYLVACALDRVPPVFCHLPPVEYKKGEAFVDSVLSGNIVPEALFDYVARQVFSLEIGKALSKETLIKYASFEGIKVKGGMFDMYELERLNREHLKVMSESRFLELVESHCGCSLTQREKTVIYEQRETLSGMDDACKRIRRMRDSLEGI